MLLAPFRFIRKHLAAILISGLLLVMLAAFLIWRFGGGYARIVIRDKLQAIVSGHLNAQLEMGSLSYQYPLGVVVEDVSLVTDEAHLTIASFKTLHLQLGKSPFAEGPLVIEKIDIDQPTLHLIRDQNGYAGVRKLLRAADQGPRVDQKIKEIPRLSDVFHLIHMQLTGMTVKYEDHRLNNPVPLLWENLDIKVESTSVGKALHSYTFTGRAGKLAEIKSTGSMDLDQLFLKIDNLILDAELTREQTSSPLPPAIQDLLTKLNVTGDASFKMSGNVPLRTLGQTSLSGKLLIKKGTAMLPGTHRQLSEVEIDLDCNLVGSNGSGKLNILKGKSGTIEAELNPVAFSLNLENQDWSISPVLAKLISRPAVQPPESLETQPFTLQASVQLTRYPNELAAKIVLDGTRIRFDAADQELAIFGVLRLEDLTATIQSLRVEGLGGILRFQGTIHADSGSFATQTQATNIDLAAVRSIVEPQIKDARKGILTGLLKLEMMDNSIATLKGSGSIQLKDGQFGRVPVLAGISKTIGIGEDLFVSDSADIRFGIESEKIQIEKLAIRSKAIKIVGKGNIGFDESLDLKLYAASSGDWGKNVKETNIPLLSDLGGLLAGGTQKVVNGLSSQISSMTVTGTLKDPKVRPDPAPVLTDPIKKLFSSDEK